MSERRLPVMFLVLPLRHGTGELRSWPRTVVASLVCRSCLCGVMLYCGASARLKGGCYPLVFLVLV